MTVFTEGDIQLTLPSDINVRKFDDEAEHGLSHCMKAVDYIAELPDRIWFIEFKDPYHASSQPKDRKKFIEGFLSGTLDEKLKHKFRDSFLYEWASENLNKPVHYLVLVAIDSLSAADLLTRTEHLQRKLPMTGPVSGVWKRQIAGGCAIFNIEAWNKQFPKCPVARIPTAKTG